MSVQTSNSIKVRSGDSTTVYLMQLRRRMAETKSSRRKLEVVGWARPQLDVIPIRKRLARAVRPARSEEVVSGTGPRD